MQPTYLPWSGYFGMIAKVDKFVVLDDVQFDSRSWQSRNKILLNGSVQLLSVPVRKCPRETLIKDVLIGQQPGWREKHAKTLEYAYGKSRYFHEVAPYLHELHNADTESLSRLDQVFIKGLAAALDLRAEFILASDLACSGSRAHHLAEICQAVGADVMVSASGSRGYLQADGFEQWSGIDLEFHEYAPASYPQRGAQEFISHLSVVDLVANVGLREARAHIEAPGSVV